jgi:cysteinyl-tRNA synthetase
MDNIGAAYDKLVKAVAKLQNEGEVDKEKFEEYKNKFIDALGNDLNTSMGITLLYEILKADMNDKTKLALIESFDGVLSLNLLAGEAAADTVDPELEAYVLSMIEERKTAKKEKNFARADEIRNELLEKGIVLEDTREGVKWKRA